MTIPVLYLSYTGLLEPLGQSQVLAYLERLAEWHAITLVTFEKPSDLADARALQSMRERCGRSSIEWLPRRYHRRPRVLATLYDLFALIVLAIRHGRRGGLVHCRGYVAATGAWIAGWFTRIPFVFDMRALWLDEMHVAGRLRRGSSLDRILRLLERRLLRDAAAVISLTHAAVDLLRQQDGVLEDQTFAVVPTCVDLRRFEDIHNDAIGMDVSLGSVGTIGSGWFPIDELVESFLALRCAVPDTRLMVTTRDDPACLMERLAGAGVPADCVDVQACEPEGVPARMAGLSAGFCVFSNVGNAKLGSMPTRMGEFLASGVPVIGNRGVGDIAALIEHYGVGVVLERFDEPSRKSAVVDLLALMKDPSMANRCRAAAQEYFSVERGADRYGQIYRSVINTGAGVIEAGDVQ